MHNIRIVKLEVAMTITIKHLGVLEAEFLVCITTDIVVNHAGLYYSANFCTAVLFALYEYFSKLQF